MCQRSQIFCMTGKLDGRQCPASSSAVAGGSPPIAGGILDLTPEYRKIIVDQFAARCIWGYVDRQSVRPGDHFRLALSTIAGFTPGDRPSELSGHVEIFRIGWYRPSVDRIRIWRSDRITVVQQPIVPGAASVGARWPTALEVSTDAGWRSGYYSIDFVPIAGPREESVACIVVTNPASSGDVRAMGAACGMPTRR